MKKLLLLLMFAFLSGCADEVTYYIKSDIDNGGKVRYRVGYDSALGFTWYHTDKFSTLSEAQYNLKNHLKR